jgi:tetratricopeptide (TPR) repeat protein
MNKMLLTAVLVLALSAQALADSSDEEARKYLVRGMAAIEMAKSNEELAAAALEFKKATEIAPNMAAAWYNLGSVQVKIGQTKEAIVSYRKYLALAPQAEDAGRINDEIIKLEYRLERQNMAEKLTGSWSSPNGQKFKLQLDGMRLQLTREQSGDDILTIKSMGTHTGPMTDVPLVFIGTLVGDKITGDYQQATGKYSGYCDLPERKGSFEGTIDASAGKIRIIYNRVTFEYEMKFKSLLSDELVCRQTKRQETPGYVLELKRNP